MRHTARMTALLSICSVLAIGAVAVAQGGNQDEYPPDGHKVTICHGTASESNPYVLITVDEEALGGHFGHDGTGGAPGHGANSRPDVFPDADGACPDEEGPVG
jgi:hypothetical protein